MPQQLTDGTWQRILQDDKDHTDFGSDLQVFNNTNVEFDNLKKGTRDEIARLRQQYNEANDNFRPYLNWDRGTKQEEFITYVNDIIKNPNKHYDQERLLAQAQQEAVTEEIKNPNSGKQQTTLVIGGTDEAGNKTQVNLANETLEQLVGAIGSGIPLQGIEVTNPDGSKSTIDPKALTGALNKTQQQEQAKMIEQVGLGAVLGKYGKDLELRGRLAELQQQGNYDLALDNQQNTATITKSMLDNWLGSSELANQRASTILNARL